MTFKEFYKREKHVVIHGQTRRFRIVKYIILLAIGVGVFQWQGLRVTVALFLFIGVVGVATHFFFRYKTDAWTKSWGPYKRIPLNICEDLIE